IVFPLESSIVYFLGEIIPNNVVNTILVFVILRYSKMRDFLEIYYLASTFCPNSVLWIMAETYIRNSSRIRSSTLV
ncbi:hypothetical protein L9F63_017813, partial [Diploptera punctata]